RCPPRCCASAASTTSKAASSASGWTPPRRPSRATTPASRCCRWTAWSKRTDSSAVWRRKATRSKRPTSWPPSKRPWTKPRRSEQHWTKRRWTKLQRRAESPGRSETDPSEQRGTIEIDVEVGRVARSFAVEADAGRSVLRAQADAAPREPFDADACVVDVPRQRAAILADARCLRVDAQVLVERMLPGQGEQRRDRALVDRGRRGDLVAFD